MLKHILEIKTLLCLILGATTGVSFLSVIWYSFAGVYIISWFLAEDEG